MSSKNKRIVVLGGGTAGWVSAAVFSKDLKHSDYNVTIVESSDILPVGVGEASIPPIYSLIEYLGLNDSDLITKVDGSLKYGIHFENWSKLGDHYMHAFGELGTPFKDVSFLDFWMAAGESTGVHGITPFFPTAIAAYNNKFAPPAPRPKNTPESAFYPLCNLSYALHFDAKLMANYLKDYSLANGVKHISATVQKVELTSTGEIKSLHLESGQSVEGDLFIDCSGASGRLIQQELKREIEDWSSYLPCDRAIAVQTKNSETELPSYTKAIAMKAGWRWQIPLQSRTGNGYVYCSKYISDDAARAELLNTLPDELLTEPRIIPFKTGCLKEPWYKNCVAIGLSSGFMEPMESTSIHLIYYYAMYLRETIEKGKWNDQALFNNTFSFQTERIRDFLIMHYYINQRNDEPFWLDCQNMAIPNSLEKKLDEFKKTGKIKVHSSELFSFESWVQVLIGQNYLENYDQFYNVNIPCDAAKQFFQNVYIAIQNEVDKLPSHRKFLSDLANKQTLE
ncbi:tryptophan halogenase family protein [Agaribacter flavus]|uniref:Tryptophan halogenase family protein n=1 Tax=Agaribacter flavus TaxID=1902781 RepID=A0ABV7FJ10_9ALTE